MDGSQSRVHLLVAPINDWLLATREVGEKVSFTGRAGEANPGRPQARGLVDEQRPACVLCPAEDHWMGRAVDVERPVIGFQRMVGVWILAVYGRGGPGFCRKRVEAARDHEAKRALALESEPDLDPSPLRTTAHCGQHDFQLPAPLIDQSAAGMYPKAVGAAVQRQRQPAAAGVEEVKTDPVE